MPILREWRAEIRRELSDEKASKLNWSLSFHYVTYRAAAPGPVALHPQA